MIYLAKDNIQVVGKAKIDLTKGLNPTWLHNNKLKEWRETNAKVDVARRNTTDCLPRPPI
jgi:hypothetical protein